MSTLSDSTAPSPAIQTHGLTRHFGSVVAVDGIDLSVPLGATFGLLGPDGAGKSTTLRMLATVLRPTSGGADILGSSIDKGRASIRSTLGYMPQRFCMYPDLTVAENIEFFATIRGIAPEARAQRKSDLLAAMGMSAFGKRRAGRLSGGMKQKLMLAVTLLTDPTVLLLDEPTTGVDPVSRREFWDILAQLHEKGTTIIVATPYMDEAERCTELLFLDSGRVVRTGTPDGITGSVPGLLFEVAGGPPRPVVAAAENHPQVVSAHVLGDLARIVWDGEPDPEAVSELVGRPVTEVHQVPMDMETAFIVLAQEAAA